MKESYKKEKINENKVNHRRENETVLFISYFTGIDANCPAEWADDRLRAISKEDHKVILLTGLGSRHEDSENHTVFRTPSLAWDDFNHELRWREGLGQKTSPLYLGILLALVFIIGKPIQLFTKFITRGGSGGKWSWIALTTPVCIWIVLTKKITWLYCTGGPPSAYIVGALASFFSKAKFIIEFQDPLFGAETNQSPFKRRMVTIIERWLIGRSDLSVYVTKKSADDAKLRYPVFGKKINANYPGAWNFQIVASTDSSKRNYIEILHLGTLYGSRNLDLLFKSVDQMYEKGLLAKGSVKFTNVGSVYTENVEDYKARKDFQLIPERGRLDALRIASHADILLLVQHTDKRSAETIPYKIYDYLNLNKPIIALTLNQEITNLCQVPSFFSANCLDENEIKTALLNVIRYISDSNTAKQAIENNLLIDIQKQITNLLQ